MFGMNIKEMKNLLDAYIKSEGMDYVLMSECEYPRYGIFRISEVSEQGATVQYQIFRDGTIMKNGKQVLNWRQSEELLKAVA